MRLGITGLLPNKASDIDASAFQQIRNMGFTGTAFSVGDAPAEISTEQAAEIGRVGAAEGIAIVEYGRYQTTLVDPNQAVRDVHVADLREACRVASALSCPAVVAGIGSFSPAGQWFAHPLNFAPETCERLITSLSDVVKIAEDFGVVLALECHVTVTLNNSKVARDVLDAVGSPSLKVHLDPVNWMTLETVYESGAAISKMFSELGPDRIQGAHSKGVKVEDQLIVHLNETYTGADDDVLDHATFLRELSAMPGDPYLVIEHLSVDEMPKARALLLATAAQLGLRFTGQESGGYQC